MRAYLPSMTPLAVVCFVCTAGVLAIFLFVGIYGLSKKSRQLATIAGIAGGLCVLIYSVILLGFSLFSSDVDLSVGEKKYFCEIDCHLAYQVAAVSIDKAVGGELDQIVSNGEFLVVELRTWFDPSTISAKRGERPLTPNERVAILTDSRGHSFTPSPKSAAVLAAHRLHSTPLLTPLRPGQSYTSYLVFEVPARTEGLKLWLRSDDEVGALLWGNELSPLHGKVRFLLSPAVRTTRSSL
jgi:hypothetical protein